MGEGKNRVDQHGKGQSGTRQSSGLFFFARELHDKNEISGQCIRKGNAKREKWGRGNLTVERKEGGKCGL